MRIGNNFGVYNISYSQSGVAENKLPEIFQSSLKKSDTYPKSYFSSPKYLELKEFIKKYDLTDLYSLNPEVAFASVQRADFKKKFGNIKSSSMQFLMLNEYDKGYDSKLSDRINTMRRYCKSWTDRQYVDNLEDYMKREKIGNCTDISAVTINSISLQNAGFKGDILYASMFKDDLISNHAAVLIRGSKGNETLNKDSVILDNWLGGVFRYGDWLKILQKLYGTKGISTYIDKNFEIK